MTVPEYALHVARLVRRFSLSLSACAVALLAAPLQLQGQAVAAISPQQCVWRTGDNLRWAEPAAEDAGWQPYSTWTLGPGQTRMWVRCHADLASLRNAAQAAVQVTSPAAYQIFVNGQAMGGDGNLASGHSSANTIRSWPLEPGALTPQPAIVAVRITWGFPVLSGFIQAAPVTVSAGDRTILDALRDTRVLTQVNGHLNALICFGILGTVGFVLLGLFLTDRSRLDLLALGIHSLSLAAIYGSRFSTSALADYPAAINVAIYAIATPLAILTRAWIPFVLAKRRMSLWFWIPIAFLVLRGAAALIGALIPFGRSTGLAAAISWTAPLSYYATLLCTVAPFVAFWPYNRIRRSMVPLAALCIGWGAFMAVFFLSGAATLGGRVSPWASLMVSAELFVTLSVIVTLMGLLFREQRRAVLERAELAGEMASAREIQQYFIPHKLPEIAGLAIQSVYLPSRDVGGDFFQVLPNPLDGSTLIVVGDVAGKGLKAGMLSALIVGAIRTASQFTCEPSEILDLLNQRLQGRGLVTCLALRIDRGGKVRLANAGHLPPYVNGKEMALEGTLPLGAAQGIAFQTVSMQLAPADSLLLISDGVVEARSKSGELFGFDRTASLSTRPVEEIAARAQDFGQEDDITVLALTFSPVEMAVA